MEELENPNDGDSPSFFASPGRSAAGGGYFFSCPASPVHFILASAPYSVAAYDASSASSLSLQGPFEFDGVAAAAGRSMTSADELFVNGQIRPLKLSSHHQRLQSLAPLLDLEEQQEDEEEGEDDAGDREEAPTAEGIRGRDLRIRSRSVHRRARSMSPARSPRFEWQEDKDDVEQQQTAAEATDDGKEELGLKATPEQTETAAESASESPASSARNGKRWVFLKDFLNRSKSEGSGRGASASTKERFWHSISFSPSKSKAPAPPTATSPAETQQPEQPKVRKQKKPPANGAAGGRRTQRRAVPSAHERHYAANRAQSEEMRRRTFLPYRQGLLLGCLGFNSRSYSAFHGLATTLSAVSSSSTDGKNKSK